MENQKSSSKKIVIIDDEADFCLLMKNFFTKKNYTVYIFNRLEEGMKNLAVINPDMIFLDNHLPDGRGWERASYIHQHYPHISVHLVSAFHYDADVLTHYSSARIWEKPISFSNLNKYLN